VALAIPTAVGIERLITPGGGFARVTALLASLSLAVSVLCGLIMWTAQAPYAFGSMTREEAIEAGFEMKPLFDRAGAAFDEDDKIALYGEPRGYYLDIPYLWADYGYHTLLPYKSMDSPEHLLRAYHDLGITAVLINKSTARSTYEGTDAAGRLIRGLVARGDLREVTDTRRGVLYRVATENPGREAAAASVQPEESHEE
jgi:hypothetical protein